MDNISALETKTRLLGSLLQFTQVFYKLRTGRDFEISFPVGRESHFITVCRELNKVFNQEITRLGINIPPRYGKTELLIHFVAWGLAHYPDSNFLFVSYSHSLATKQTQTIKQIIELPYYRKMFGVEISPNTSAKDNFETIQGGSVYAAGAQGTITGRGAGIRNCLRYGGSIVIDDIIKPAEASSDTVRESTNDWYYNTLLSRLNNYNTSIINSGQRTNEHDLSGLLKEDPEWSYLIIPALDELNNALYPTMHDRDTLLKMKEESPYVFAAQYQQDPQPVGGGIFKEEWFHLIDYEPDIISTFITVDTAETDKSYNDATVFSFWGLYRIKTFDVLTDIYALHWIDCLELRVEPKDLQSEFMQFFADCMRHKLPPKFAAIEKKSTGTTLVSVLSNFQGLQVIPIERTKVSNGNSISGKAERFLNIQPYVAKKLISLPRYGKHTHQCIEHCKKITANMSHRFDDIADTLYDAIKIALIDKTLINIVNPNRQNDAVIAAQVMSKFKKIQQIRQGARW